MRASFRQGAPADTQADTLCFGLFEGDDAPADLDRALGGRLARLIESGEAKGSFKKVAVLHPDGDVGAARAIAVGLGKRAEFTPERARIAGAVGAGAGTRRGREAGSPGRSRRASTRRPIGARAGRGRAAGRVPVRPLQVAATTTTARKGRRRSRSSPARTSRRDRARSTSWSEHQNTARDLQNLPSNDLTPTKLAEHALRRAAEIEGLEGEAFGPDEIARARDGRPARRHEGLARGAALHRAALRRRRRRPLLALVGKAVTFDTGGISIKPSGKMQEMKMDMSGGSAVIEATAAIARLGLPVRLLTRRARRPRTCPPVTRPSRATSSASRTARRSRSTTPTPRAG